MASFNLEGDGIPIAKIINKKKKVKTKLFF